MQFLQSLCESKLFPSKASLERKRDSDVAELAYFYLLAMRIMRLESETEKFAKGYAHKTAEWGTYFRWRDTATDLYVLLHRLSFIDHPDKGKAHFPVDIKLIHRWLAEEGRGQHDNRLARRVLTGLDFSLRINSQSSKAMRRIVADWDDQSVHQKSTTLKKLYDKLHTIAPRSEILKQIKELADEYQDEYNEEISGD